MFLSKSTVFTKKNSSGWKYFSIYGNEILTPCRLNMWRIYLSSFIFSSLLKKSGTLICLHWPTSGSVSFTIHFFECGLNWNWNIIVEWRRFGFITESWRVFVLSVTLIEYSPRRLPSKDVIWLMSISELQTHLLSMKWVHFFREDVPEILHSFSLEKELMVILASRVHLHLLISL